MGKMIFYHGSNTCVTEPKLLFSKRFLDFGHGFYLTTDLEQATKWAFRTATNRGEGTPTVSVFQMDDCDFFKLEVLSFEAANLEWLRFISANRSGDSRCCEPYDIIYGPVADDQAARTINNYLKGYFNENIAIQLLLPQKLKDQYLFRTERALSMLHFVEEKRL